MDTTADALTKLREQILEQTIPLLGNGSMPAEDQFRLILQMARTKGSPELYEKAFSIAQSLDEGSKLSAHLDLLADLDATIQVKQGPDHEGSSDESLDNSEDHEENHNQDQ